ncbi:MAG: hypothetical protein ACTHK7_07490 [Aureliella sp.]
MPKPSLLLILCSLVVLAACVVLVSVALSTFAIAWEPCAFIGGMILLPLPIALAWYQYRGVFRMNVSAAFVAAVLLMIVGGFAWLASITALVEAQGDGGVVRSVVLPMVAVGAIASFAGWLDLRWARQLRSVEAPWQLPRGRFTLRELQAATAVVACMIALTAYLVRATPPQYAEHVSRDRSPIRLPDNATDVSYCQGDRGEIAIEFTTDEASFVRWAQSDIGSLESQSANIPIKPITGSHEISCYGMLSSKVTGGSRVTITNGLYYLWSKEDRLVHAAFDRSTGRAYYHAHFH